MRKRRSLARGAAYNDRIGSVLDLVIDQTPELPVVHRSVSIHGSDDRDSSSRKNSLLHVFPPWIKIGHLASKLARCTFARPSARASRSCLRHSPLCKPFGLHRCLYVQTPALPGRGLSLITQKEPAGADSKVQDYFRMASLRMRIKMTLGSAPSVLDDSSKALNRRTNHDPSAKTAISADHPFTTLQPCVTRPGRYS